MNNQQSSQEPTEQQIREARMPPRPIPLQPAQLQQLAKQCSSMFAEAKKIGMDTPAGQEQYQKAQRLRQVLLQYQQQQQQQQQQRQNSQPQQQQSQSPQVAPQSQPQHHQPQTQAQQQQIHQPQSIQSPQVAQAQAINQRNFAQQSPLPQQQSIPQQQNNAVNSNGATVSPSPMAQNVAAPNSQGTGTPNPQNAPKNSFQQLQQIKHVLNEFQKKLKAIDDAKKNSHLPPESLNKLLQQEQILKDRFTSYKTAAITISQNLQKQQQQQQQQQQLQQQQNFQQQSRSQSANQLPQDAPSSQVQSPALMQNIVQNQQLNPQQAGDNLQRSGSATSIPRSQNQAVPNQNSNYQFQQSPQAGQQQIAQQVQQQQQQQGQINQMQPQQQRQIPQLQVQQQQQQQQQQQPVGTPQQQQPQAQIPNQAQQARSNLQSRTGTPQPQTGSVVGRSASPNTPVTNVNAAAKPNGTNGNVLNQSQAANVFKTSVPSIAVPNQINVKPPVAVSINQNRPSLTGGHGLSAPALSTPALMKLPPYEMQSDRVLSKRKLSELVKTVGADEGDGETTIDGDVEELLLDLADEFVSNVTGFACRLAKHRKSENLDVKDVQLHLEKNWNIRIPGYSSDEIRSVRKWAPSAAHNQRIQGIGISKSVEQNK